MGETYRVTFERIGRNRSVAPLTVVALGEADLCRHIRKHARPHLSSRDFDVRVDLDKGTGFFACGFHDGGRFTITAERPGDRTRSNPTT